MSTNTMKALSSRTRPRSEDYSTVSEADTRRPSVPTIQTHFASMAPLSMSARIKNRRKSRPSLNVTAGFSTHLTPPETPMSPPPDLDVPSMQQSLFHNYLRAMHSFDPSAETMPNDDASQSATAIRAGDLILVHCIHANGWADGTVLNTGIRGWLPTNYCEAYDHPHLRNLLNAMTQFWDLIGASEDASLSTFVRQDYIRGLIAGVRYLLERADCLHREAPTVKQNAGVRRMRKGLLADLSSLVQIAKRLQETIGEAFAGEVIHVLLDDLIARAFRVVTRAVSFTDVWTQETGADQQEDLEPPPMPLGLVTPPIDTAGLTVDTKSSARPDTTPIDSAKHFPDQIDTNKNAKTVTSVDNDEPKESPWKRKRHSMVFAPANGYAAHRMSMVTNENPVTRSGPLASEQLAKVHDICISHIGAFIGHHLQSRPCSELVATTERLVDACRSMLAIVEEVHEHDTQNSQSVQQAKHDFELKVDDLAKSTQAVFRFSDCSDDDVVMMPDQTSHLISVGTSLIRNTGECVVRTRQLIEQIGDFELSQPNLTLTSGTSQETFDRDDSKTPQNEPREERNTPQKRLSLGPRLSRTMMFPPPPVPMKDPDVAETAKSETVQTVHTVDIVSSGATVIAAPQKPLPPPPPPPRRRSMARMSLMSPVNVVDSSKSAKSARSDSVSPARKDSVGMSIAGSTDTCNSSTRDSSLTAVSQVSTRATTPEQVKDAGSPQLMLMSSFASISSIPSLITDDSIDAEAQLLQKTYANELTFNKDGQVTGGSLPALVEQLTTHDSAPDPLFVTGFFLTFRKFCDPRELAQALIYRFEYIGESRAVGTPTRLRIFNIFKGWLETYWSADADRGALGEIRFFAMHKLKLVLPSAGDRLIELTRRVTEAYSNGTMAGPLVSGVGKTSMSIGTQHGALADTPESLINSKQLNALRLATGSGPPCNFVDYDPLEIARQITLLVTKAYCEIRPDELLSMEWGKPNTKKAPHVRNMCLLNTDLAHFVGETILAPEEAKKRANVIKHWAKIGTACLELSNYDSVMAIMCSINSSMVQRLKRTWDLVSKKTKAKLDELEKVIDMSKNYTSLRRRLDTPTAPCLPFLGVYLTDLTFVVAGNPKRRELPGSASETGDVVSVINFDVYMRIAKIISHLQKFQVPYNLNPIPEMQTWLEQNLERMRSGHDDMVATFHRRSLALEPKQEEKKHSSALSAFHRADNSDERVAKMVAPKQESSPTDRFDFFHRSTSLLSMRSHVMLAPISEPIEQKRASAQ